MRRALRVSHLFILLWFFYRFDPYSAQITIDGGVEVQAVCEQLAAQYGYLTVLVSAREAVVGGKRVGRWQRACFEGPASLKASSITVVR